MKKSTQSELLKQKIILLRERQSEELVQLRMQMDATYESIKPVNIIKKALHEVVSSPEVGSDLMSNVIGLATGYLSRKVLIGSTHNPIKKILGVAAQFVITNFVSRHSDKIKEEGGSLLHLFFKHRKAKKEAHKNGSIQQD